MQLTDSARAAGLAAPWGDGIELVFGGSLATYLEARGLGGVRSIHLPGSNSGPCEGANLLTTLAAIDNDPVLREEVEGAYITNYLDNLEMVLGLTRLHFRGLDTLQKQAIAIGILGYEEKWSARFRYEHVAGAGFVADAPSRDAARQDIRLL